MSKDKEKRIMEVILDSAKKLFAQFGPRKTTMDEIAQVAGVGKGTIYYYFKDKEDVFLRVVHDEAEKLYHRLQSAASEADNPEQKLNAFFYAKLASLTELVNLRWLYNYMDFTRWSSLEKATAELARQEQELVEQILEEGKNTGAFAIEDVAKIAQNLLRFVSAFGKTLPQVPSPNELKKDLADLLRFVFEGLRSRREMKPETGKG